MMDEAKTGNLLPVTIGKPDWAFIPASLPRKWLVPYNLWPLLAKAKEELARLDGIGQALPDPDLLLRPLISREALRSSSLAGTYASAEELLLFDLEPEAASATSDQAMTGARCTTVPRPFGTEFVARHAAALAAADS